MSTIFPGVSYHETLVMNFKELATHYDKICETLSDTTGSEINFFIQAPSGD